MKAYLKKVRRGGREQTALLAREIQRAVLGERKGFPGVLPIRQNVAVVAEIRKLQ